MVSDGRKPKKGLTAAQERKAKELEASLFGGGGAALDAFGTEDTAAEASNGGDFWSSLAGGAAEEMVGSLYEDRQGEAGVREAGPQEDQQPQQPQKKRRVWEDLDDVTLTVPVAGQARVRKLRQTEEETQLTGRVYEERLRQQHARLNSRTTWATEEPAKDDEDDEDLDETLALGADKLLGTGGVLPAGVIAIAPVTDGNKAEPTGGVVRSLQFHPNGQLLLTSGLDKRLRLFQVDGIKNPKVQSVFFADMPVHCASFANGGAQVVAAGRRKFFYIYDLGAAKVERVAKIQGFETEKSLESFAASPSADNPTAAFMMNGGFIALVSLKSRQLVGSLKMSGTARAAAFSPDGNDLLTMGGDGTVYTWDMRTQRCRDRKVDEGTLNGTSLACADGFFATGSDSGAVNLHLRGQGGSPTASSAAIVARYQPTAAAMSKPAKTFLHLTTTVDSLAFSPDSQILAMSSRMNKNALRLVHLPTKTVFSNWPTAQTPLNYVHSLAFSPGGGYFAVGTAKGRALLYRLKHYPAA